MILLPIIERELRVAARSRRTYRNRFLAGVTVTSALLWTFTSNRFLPHAGIGAQIFENITEIALVVALLAGFFQTADCISEERREGTLGLLFLTDLRGVHIVFGKLFANSLPALFALITIVPVLGVPFLLGGVSPGELERASLVLIVGLALSLTAGLFASSLVKDDRASLVVTLFLVGLPAIAALPLQARFSAFWSLRASRDQTFLLTAKQDEFWTSILLQCALAVLYLMLATWRARAIWREKPSSAMAEKVLTKVRSWTRGAPAKQARWRTELLDENPAIWLACRHRERVAALWVALVLCAAAMAAAWRTTVRVDAIVGIFISIAAHWAVKIAFAFAAARALSEEARNGSRELLFTTHLSPQQLVAGHVWGLARTFALPLIAVILGDLWLMRFGRGDIVEIRTFLGQRLGIFALDLVTITVFGLWDGFRAQRAGKAAIRTLLFVIVIPNCAWAFAIGGTSRAVFLVWIVMDAVLIAWAAWGLSDLRANVGGKRPKLRELIRGRAKKLDERNAVRA